MLINLTNHPHAKWGDAQLQKAIQTYHTIHDIPFPSIDPQLSIHEVVTLAEVCAQECLSVLQGAEDAPHAIHVMGEMTFTHAIVNIFQRRAVDCVASTSERLVTEQDGVKTVHFEFQQFRPYHQHQNS